MASTALIGFSAYAQELDGTVIVRFNHETGVAEKMVTKRKLKTKKEAQKAVLTGHFESLEGRIAISELDREAGASSWFWNCGSWCGGGGGVWATTPTFFFYGVTFFPIYSWGWNNCGCNYFGYGGW